jgi:hypothetical protein
MGTIYSVFPLDRKCAEWLDTQGVAHPPVTATSRYPTPREIAEALRGYKFIVHSDSESREWSAQIDGEGDAWAQIHVRDFCSEATPHEFYFSGGCPEIVFTVTERLAVHCGTLVVLEESGCRPFVVSPGTDVEDLLRRYEVS